MNQKLLNDFIEALKTEHNASDIESDPNENDGELRTHGTFKIKERKFSFICFFSKESSFMSVEFPLKIDVTGKNKSAIKLYKAANSVNNTCPGMKCVVDKHTEKEVYLTFSSEITSSSLSDFSQLIDMLDVLPTGGMFFINGLHQGD